MPDQTLYRAKLKIPHLRGRCLLLLGELSQALGYADARDYCLEAQAIFNEAGEFLRGEEVRRLLS